MIEKTCPKCAEKGHTIIMEIVYWNPDDKGEYVCPECREPQEIELKEK